MLYLHEKIVECSKDVHLDVLLALAEPPDERRRKHRHEGWELVGARDDGRGENFRSSAPHLTEGIRSVVEQSSGRAVE